MDNYRSVIFLTSCPPFFLFLNMHNLLVPSQINCGRTVEKKKFWRWKKKFIRKSPRVCGFSRGEAANQD